MEGFNFSVGTNATGSGEIRLVFEVSVLAFRNPCGTRAAVAVGSSRDQKLVDTLCACDDSVDGFWNGIADVLSDPLCGAASRRASGCIWRLPSLALQASDWPSANRECPGCRSRDGVVCNGGHEHHWRIYSSRQSPSRMSVAADWTRQRRLIADTLSRDGRRNLVVVRYGPSHSPFNEWVFNAANIDASPVVWARDMGDNGNEPLLRYFKDRAVWLIEVDSDNRPFPVSAYLPFAAKP